MIDLILYFKNSKGVRKEIGKTKNEKETFKLIHQFLDEHNFKSYYMRIWEKDGCKYVDVGSHTEFFIVED